MKVICLHKVDMFLTDKSANSNCNDELKQTLIIEIQLLIGLWSSKLQ